MNNNYADIFIVSDVSICNERIKDDVQSCGNQEK